MEEQTIKNLKEQNIYGDQNIYERAHKYLRKGTQIFTKEHTNIYERAHRGETAVDFDLEGTPRGNCTG